MATLATTPEVAKKSSHKTLWTVVGIAIVILVVGTYMMPNTPNFAAGFSLRQLVSIELILFTSGLMSGLSGFGFSAVGAACLLFIQPILEVPLLQTLSTANQLLSVEQLRQDMPEIDERFLGWSRPLHYGRYLWRPHRYLAALPPAREATDGRFGSLLVLYSVYSMLKPAGTKMHGFGGPGSGSPGRTYRGRHWRLHRLSGSSGGRLDRPARLAESAKSRNRAALHHHVSGLFSGVDCLAASQLHQSPILAAAGDHFARGAAGNLRRRR